MAQNPGTGSTSYVRYGYESTFKTSPGDSSLSTYFGHNVKFSPKPNTNIERIPDLNDRNYSKYALKQFEGSFDASFQVSNFYFMKGIFGSVADAGAGPYTHTYSEATTPPSVTIQSSEELGTTDSDRTYVGCVFDELSLDINIREVINGTITGKYAKESKDSTLNTTGNASDSEEVFTFAHATIEVPNATALTLVQSFNVRIVNNFEMLPALGTVFPANYRGKQRVYEFKINKIREQDSDLLDKFYGSTTTMSDPNPPANVADLELTITNGLSGTSERSFVALFDSIQVVSPEGTLEPVEVIKEGATLYALNLNATSKAIYTNNTAVSP